MQVDWWTLALQTVNFLVVMWLLTRFLYRPVRRIIEAREAADRKAAEDAAAKSDQAEATRASYERKLAELDEQARKKDAAFRAQIEKEREASRQEAREEAEKMLAEARETIERDREEAMRQMRGRIADLAGLLAAKALEDRPATAEDAVARAAAYIDGLPDAERGELTRDLDGDGATLSVVTARSLCDGARGTWQAALADRFGPGIRIGFEVDPALLDGTLLRFPHALLDFSVSDRLKRLTREMEA